MSKLHEYLQYQIELSQQQVTQTLWAAYLEDPTATLSGATLSNALQARPTTGETTLMNLANRMKAERERRGLSRYAVALQLQVALNTVTRFEEMLGANDENLLKFFEFYTLEGVTLEDIVRARAELRKDVN